MSTSSAQISKLQAEAQQSRAYSPGRDLRRRILRSPSARIGGVLVIFFVVLSAAILLFENYDAPSDRNLRARYAEPDCLIARLGGDSEAACEFPFGTDKNGRSIFRRVGNAIPVTLVVALASVSVSLAIGFPLGLISGFFGKTTDTVIMRSMDIILAFPSLLLAIALVTVLGAGLINGMLAVAITQVPIYARLARSMAISLRNTEFVTAARSTGSPELSIVRRHILPNSLAPIIVQATLGLGTAVIETAALGFLGLGQQPPYPELGKMLADSQEALASGKYWVMLFPGLAIIMIVLGFNLLGDGLRDALDPRLRGND